MQSYTAMPGFIEYQVGTFHVNDRAPTLTFRFAKLISSIHSHPNQGSEEERTNSLYGDKGLSLARFKAWGANINFYIYFPETGETTQLEYKGEFIGRSQVKSSRKVKPKLKL